MSETAYHLNVGEYKCIVFSDGILEAEGEAYGLNCIYIEAGNEKMLVDTGCGEGFQAGTAGHLLKNMEAEGLKSADVTAIIFDHGHIDHAAGTCDIRGNPVFANARYITLKREWEHWLLPPGDNEMQNMFFSPARKYLVPMRERFELVEDNAEVLPGVRLVPAAGHTPGNAMVEITSKGERLLCIGDIIHSLKEFTEPEHCAAFDVNPEEAVKTRAKVLAEAARDGTFIFASHFSFPGLGHIKEKEGELGWEGI